MHGKKVLGIDVGASGIKGGIVDIKKGKLLTERLRLETPMPATPDTMAQTFAELVRMHNWTGLVGCGFPAIVKKGFAHSAANIDRDWIGKDIEHIFSVASGCDVKVLNDADAAGLAEMEFGAGQDRHGTVILITIGSGLGTALFREGKLIPNTEFGHVFMHGMIAEHYAANSVRKEKNLDWDEWGKRLNEYLIHVERLISPDLIILGGGVSKRFEKYSQYLHPDTPVIPAQLLNTAGAIGAAYYAWEWNEVVIP